MSFFLGDTLQPRSWSKEAAFYREILASGRSRNSNIYKAHEFLGWTIGENRRSDDGMYLSSDEGIRSMDTDYSYGDRKARIRVALVGDSYTFAQDVFFADTWGHRLEQMLGEDFQILNFGVPGYGTDQTLLRFEHDALAWQPDIVIFGVSPHDLSRAMTVYSFILFPGWVTPYSKPRFAIDAEHLRTINTPLNDPHEIFSAKTIDKLPFLEYDSGYNAKDWVMAVLSPIVFGAWCTKTSYQTGLRKMSSYRIRHGPM